MKVLIRLPWPPNGLSPNARLHWTKKNKLAGAYRKVCAQEALVHHASLHVMKECEAYDLHMSFAPPGNYRYDRDNLLARMKSGIDGIADVWGVDDSKFHYPDPDIVGTTKGGSVILEISERKQDT